MLQIVTAWHPQPIECVDYDSPRRTEKPEKLGKELALFLYYNSVGGFWEGLRQVVEEIQSLSNSDSEKAMRRHFLGEPQHEDEEEAVFE